MKIALAPLFLPPLRRHPVRESPLELATERDRRMADIGERPPRLDPHVDVDAAAARGLRVAGHAELLQQRPRLPRGSHGVAEVGTGLWIEVEPQLVRMVDVVVADGPRVERDRVHLGRPGDDRDLGRTHLVRGAPRGEPDARRLDVLRRALWDPLLKERVSPALLPGREHHALMHALRPALEGRRPSVQRPHDPGLHRDVVLNHVQLGDRRGAVRRREDDPVGT